MTDPVQRLGRSHMSGRTITSREEVHVSGDDATAMPALRCAYCDQPITDRASGLFVWARPDPPQSGYLEARFVHQACAADYEAQHKTRYNWRQLTTLVKDEE